MEKPFVVDIEKAKRALVRLQHCDTNDGWWSMEECEALGEAIDALMDGEEYDRLVADFEQ